MKNNKLISIVLALLVCLSLVVSASATNESELSFTLESSDSFVETHGAAIAREGDTLTVSVNIAKNPGILAAIATLNYDPAILKLESNKCAEGVAITAGEGKVTVMVGDLTKAVTTPSKAVPFTSTGSVVDLTFKVIAKEDVVSKLELIVNNKNLVDLNGKFTLTSDGAALNVNAVAGNHVCDAEKTIEANNGKDATCTEVGKETDLKCAHCAKVVTEGAVIPALGHNWNEGEITTAPGCTTAGVKTFTCANCGETSTEEIAAIDHSWDNGVITTEPTCTDMGVRTYTCANCGETKVDDKIPATGHAWGEYSVTKEATVDAEGEETRTCANCKATESRAIAKLPAPEKSNTGLIIAIVVVVVLAGAGVAAFFVLKNKKK